MCLSATNKAPSSFSADDSHQVCCRVNDHDNKLILDNLGISLSKAAVVTEARTVVTSEDNQQKCHIDEAAVVTEARTVGHIDESAVVMDSQQECHFDEATDIVTFVDNKSKCHARQSERISVNLEETNSSVSHKDKPCKVSERKHNYSNIMFELQ